ncbi:MAG: DUF4369 domain-containing protein [Bacteroidaceae bacterium]|nr:DUF4369 domain-containing protein [Bacteroidaceae bacterium]MBR5611749.1 DUF4369 domain-containing protein [Bacteroidaceae bacterium]
MKNYLWAVILLVAFASCSTGYKIEGSSSVLRLDGKMLFVKIHQGNEMIKVDSAEVIHGVFSMEGIVDSTVIASLYMDDENIMPFVMEDGDIRIQIDNADIMVSGTPLNDKLYHFVKSRNILLDRAYEVERLESRMIMDGKSEEEIAEEVVKEREKLSKELDDLAKTFIQENYENVLGPGVFIMLCSSFPYPVLTPVIEEIVNGAPEKFKNDSMVKGYMEVARENMKKYQTSR